MFKLIIKTPERRQWRLGSPFRKNNTVFANLPVAPFSLNVLQIFQIFVHKQCICLLACLVLFAHQDFHQFQWYICLCVRGDLRHTCRFNFQNDKEKMRKKVSELRKCTKRHWWKRISNLALRTFLSCNDFSF